MKKYRKAVFIVTYRKEKNKILYLLLRRKLHWKGWEFPKGGVEPNENLSNAVKREAKEESGQTPIKIKSYKIQGKYSYNKILKDRPGYFGQTFILFSAEIENKTIHFDKKEHSAYKWFEFDKAWSILTWPNQKNCLNIVEKDLKKEGKMTFQFWKEKEKEIIIHNDKMNIIESCIDRHAENQPNKIAFVFENEQGKIKFYNYKQLQIETNKFANLLNELNIRQSSRVFIFLPKIQEIYISILGTIKQGSIPIPLFEAFQEHGLDLRLKRGDANILITNLELSKRIPKSFNKKVLIIDSKEYKEKIKKQSGKFKTILKNKKDTAVMIFTSSTAGTPVAGIEIPHQALTQQHYTAELVLGLNKDSNYFCTAHPGWITGTIYGILAPLSIGCTNHVLESHFEAKKWIDFLKRNKISILYTAPTALRMLKPEIKKQDLKEIKNICSVGEALTTAVFDFYKSLGIEINDTYWQTETGAIVIATWKGLRKKYGSMGKAIPGITAKIINETISLKPDFPSLMTGIYKHEKMYKDYFKDGWFRTNDDAKMDKEGYFFFIGRKDDIIKTGGERVSPIEIESILMKHKSVKEAAVIGMPDEIKGNIIKAFIVLNKNFQPTENLKQELSMFVKENYAGHSYPKKIEFLKNLPKTNSGKIIRMKLRQENKD